MATKQMTVKLVINGLALLVVRRVEKYIDVLIPDHGLGSTRHYTTLMATGGAAPASPLLLDDFLLDLTAQTVSGKPGVPEVPEGLLPLDLVEGSVAHDPANCHGYGCRAALRLPFGSLRVTTSDLDGPYFYRGSAEVNITYRVTWSCTFTVAADRAVEARLSALNGAGPVTSLAFTPRAKADVINIELTTLSLQDIVTPGDVSYGEPVPDFEAYRRVAQGADALAGRPFPAAPVLVGPRASARKPCPQAITFGPAAA